MGIYNGQFGFKWPVPWGPLFGLANWRFGNYRIYVNHVGCYLTYSAVLGVTPRPNIVVGEEHVGRAKSFSC